MKSYFLSTVLLITVFCSCKKPSANSTPEMIKGQWLIHHIYLRAYNNAGLLGDSTVPNRPQPRNYVIFKNDGTLEYKFNSTTAQIGTYEVKGLDSVYANIEGKQFCWKIELLIKTNFNVKTTNAGSPGVSVDTYHSFVKEK